MNRAHRVKSVSRKKFSGRMCGQGEVGLQARDASSEIGGAYDCSRRGKLSMHMSEGIRLVLLIPLD